MKIEIPNSQLLDFHRQLSESRGSIFALLLNHQIKYFGQHNGTNIQNLLNRVGEINKKFFEIGEDGKILMTPANGEPPKPIMKKDMLFVVFEKEYGELMNEKVTVNVP